jgi:two-component system, cell cycle sensor histidine kinase and response regulator CckA
LDSHPTTDHATHESDATLPDLASAILAEAAWISEMLEICQWRGKETILLAEDEVLVRKATAEALQSAGYHVLIAESAARALQIHNECPKPVDLLLADVVMPGISGHELALTLFGLHHDLRIILMSGYTGQFAQHHLSPYKKEYLAKPFSISTLLKRVREVLDSSPLDLGADA